MKLSLACAVALLAPVAAFVPLSQPTFSVVLKGGYLDDLGAPAPKEEPEPENKQGSERGGPGSWEQLGVLAPEEEVEEDDSREATMMNKQGLDRAGPGSWDQFVDFNEFDGGDGQMGVAGDGSGNSLEKFDMSSMAKSKTMSAKNAWGKSTGYADKLIEEGVEAQRAQQLENWQNQQEVLAARKSQAAMAEQYESKNEDFNQWDLSKFGVERNQDFDMDEEFGAVKAGPIDETIELKAAMNQNAVHEINVKNPFMGFADFRAAFTPETPGPPTFSIEPREGSLDKQGIDFILRFRPDSPSVIEGYLVIETEDFKKTYHIVGGLR